MNKPFAFGIVYLVIVTVLAELVNQFISGLSSIIWAILLGLVLGNVFNLNKRWPQALKFGEKNVLGWAIILLGLQMDFSIIASYLWLLPILAIMIFISIFLGEKLGPKFGIEKECGILLGAGNAICGTSAIAAIAPVIKAKPHQTGVSISVIHLLGTLGLLAIPALLPLVSLSNESWGIMTGGTLQAVGQAIGGGYAVNGQAGEIATIVKLSRVLMLGPVALLLSLRMHKKGNSSERPKLPLFIVFFVVAVLVGNFIPMNTAVLNACDGIQHYLLVFAMAAIGSKIFYKDLLVSGPKALKVGTLIFIFQIAFIGLVIFLKHLYF